MRVAEESGQAAVELVAALPLLLLAGLLALQLLLVGYAATLVALGPGAGLQACPGGGPTQAAACLVDGALANNLASASGNKSGYKVNAVGAAGGAGALLITYGVGAAPAAFNQTGVRRFCSAEDGVLRADQNTGASTTPDTAGAAVCTAPTYLVLQ